jgi:glycosyltransferase involved in cell wall biosynthesis
VQKKRVLFLASWYPSKIHPTLGNFVQRHAEAANEYSEITSLYITSSDEIEKLTIEQDVVNEVSTFIAYYPKVKQNIPFFSNLIKYRAYLNAAKQAFSLIAKDFDLVHLNVTYPAGIFALYLKRRFDIPYLITEHWTAFLPISDYRFSRTEKYFIKKITANASLICPVSKDLKINMERFGVKNRFKVIPNVVNTNNFIANTNEASKDKCLRILHLSHLDDEHKNISGILNMVKSLSYKRTDFVVTIAGDGDITPYEKKAQLLNIPSEVLQFDTEKTTVEVAELMKESDIFLLFSNYENLPVVISEALVMGIPVISSDVGGISEMIDSSNGVLVKAKDEVALENSLNSMLDNYKSYNTNNISVEAIKKYGIAEVGKQINDTYDAILSK